MACSASVWSKSERNHPVLALDWVPVYGRSGWATLIPDSVLLFVATLFNDTAYDWAFPQRRSECRPCLDFVQASDGRREPNRFVPVRFWISGSEDSHLAHTLDVSNHGVKLAGCRGEFKVGDKIEVLYRHKHAQFRVAWNTAREGSSEKQIGAECLEPEKQVWGTEFPEQADDY